MVFEVGNKVKITETYTEDLKNGGQFLGMEGTVIAVFENVYHVQFPEAPYFKDYWIMYEDEIELVSNG